MTSSGSVVVLGAGVMGAWTAHWLRRHGVGVTIVDQYGPASSLATSGDETRVTRSAHGADEIYPRWQRTSLAQWRLLEEEAHANLLVPTGVLWFAHRDDGFEAESLATLTRLGIPAQRLEAGEMVQRWPQIAGDGITWALHEPEAGVLMARRAMLALVDRFLRDGGRLERARVIPPDETDGAGGRLARLRTQAPEVNQLRADAFVLAAGPWLASLLPSMLAGQLSVTRQELVYFATPPGDDRFDSASIPTWADYDAAYYGLPSIEGRGFKVAPDWPGPVVDPDQLDRRLSDERVAAARRLLRARFPTLAEQPVSEGRVCQYESTPDTHFIIDRHPEWENVWVVGGGSGHGFKHGPVIGEYVAAHVHGDLPMIERLDPGDGRFALGRREARLGVRTSGVAPSD
jgi:glycine/D-amino acid oxidase-like deaminating enzyme